MSNWDIPTGNPQGSPERTDEASFLLRPCQHGIGVFAAHPINAGVYLRLYRTPESDPPRKVRRSEVPGEFIKYCLEVDPEHVMRPNDFGHMEIVWFLNHADAPNAAHTDHRYHALRDIAAGEEITIDYATVDAPSA